jgi:hypothetical protein
MLTLQLCAYSVIYVHNVIVKEAKKRYQNYGEVTFMIHSRKLMHLN